MGKSSILYICIYLFQIYFTISEKVGHRKSVLLQIFAMALSTVPKQ